MVTAAILAMGIVLIYKSFFISLNTLQHLSHRLYALVLLDNKIVDLQKHFETKKEIPFSDSLDTETLKINNKPVTFVFVKDIHSVGTLEDIYGLDLGVAWREAGRDIHLSRQLFIGTYDK